MICREMLNRKRRLQANSRISSRVMISCQVNEDEHKCNGLDYRFSSEKIFSSKKIIVPFLKRSHNRVQMDSRTIFFVEVDDDEADT